jgi:DNA primase
MDKHSIATVLEHYGCKTIPERSGWQKIKCPFHDDGHASATVNIEAQAFNCFGCGIKGDTYSVIMQQEGVEFREAYILAEGITGESGNTLSKVNTSRRSVSGGTGIIAKRRGYSPPRSRRGAANGA